MSNRDHTVSFERLSPEAEAYLEREMRSGAWRCMVFAPLARVVSQLWHRVARVDEDARGLGRLSAPWSQTSRR